MSLFRETNKPDEEFYQACLNGDTDDDDAASGEVFYDSENDEYYDY